MDPQHRLFLEAAWTATEDAGYDLSAYPGGVGVFAGAATSSYVLFHLLNNPAIPFDGPLGAWEERLIAGSAVDHLPTRVSYKLGLSGPSMAVQTACSSSLVPVCLAAQSLLDVRCEMALAGGVAVMFPRSRAERGAVAGWEPRCRVFDAEPSVPVLGTGVGVVVLKPLELAMRDGDNIRAVIRGWAINNDGALRVGYSAPGLEGQAAIILEALQAGRVPPETIGYIEAHGSGTPVGDALEVAALTKAFRHAGDRRSRACALGSVKTNLGNLDAAAGVVGLIKAALAVQRGQIPQSLHFTRPPAIDFPKTPFFVNSDSLHWLQARTLRRAGVSSFGLGGTNAHVIVEEPLPLQPSGPSRPSQVLVLSAHTHRALTEAAGQLKNHLREHPSIRLADVAYTLALGRRPFQYRQAIIFGDALDTVEALASGRVILGRARKPQRPVAFMFGGDSGDPAASTLNDLHVAERDFRRHWNLCADEAHVLLGLDLRTALFGSRRSTSSISRPGAIDRHQAALVERFALQYSFASILINMGLSTWLLDRTWQREAYRGLPGRSAHYWRCGRTHPRDWSIGGWGELLIGRH